MKRYILAIFIVIYATSAIAQDVPETVSDSLAQTPEVTYSSELQRQVIEAYNNGNYEQAISLLETERDEQLSKGMESADLYYNLGNAYFRDNEIAKAILYYERALLLKPDDKDIRHNIAYANTRIEDKIPESDNFFLSEWMQALQKTKSSGDWAWFAIICFVLFIGILFLFFFSKKIVYKKIAFYTGIILIVFIIAGNVFAYRQKSSIRKRNHAIVMTGSAVVRSSPDKNSNQVFILHSGTKVKVTKDDRDWCEIEIASGSVGWVEKDKLEVI